MRSLKRSTFFILTYISIGETLAFRAADSMHDEANIFCKASSDNGVYPLSDINPVKTTVLSCFINDSFSFAAKIRTNLQTSKFFPVFFFSVRSPARRTDIVLGAFSEKRRDDAILIIYKCEAGNYARLLYCKHSTIYRYKHLIYYCDSSYSPMGL